MKRIMTAAMVLAVMLPAMSALAHDLSDHSDDTIRPGAAMSIEGSGTGAEDKQKHDLVRLVEGCTQRHEVSDVRLCINSLYCKGPVHSEWLSCMRRAG